MTRWLLLCAGLAAGLQGCGAPTIRAEDYPRHCATAADCTLVTTGDVCSGCSCAQGAIRADARSQYDRDWQAAQRMCRPTFSACAADCVAFTLECNQGTCSARPDNGFNAADAGP